MRLTISLCLLAAAALLAGCASTRPIHYYTVDPPQAPLNRSNPDGSSIVVGNTITPEVLQDERIRYRSGANDAGAYEYHRWTQRPGAMVRDVLVRALRASGKYRRVLESSSSATGDYLLRGKLHEFHEVDKGGIQTRIWLHVEMVDMRTGRNVWDHSVERTEPVEGKTIDNVVQSMDRNLQQVVAEVAAGIDQFLATQH